MRRRSFVVGLGVAAAWHPCALAEQTRTIPRLGILLSNSPQIDPVAPLIQGLKAAGYTDGETLSIEYRYAEAKRDRLPRLAAELVQLNPNVIFAYGGDVAPYAKQATVSIPIVVMVSNDPIQSGLVTSTQHPGANITGISLVYDELAGKLLEFLKEAMSRISRVAVLWNPDHADPEFRETQKVAAARGIQLQSLEVRQPNDFDRAFRALIAEPPEALIIVSSRLLLTQRQEIADFVKTARIPAVGSWGDWAKAGLLFTYGPNIEDAMRGIAVYVVKILKGSRPGDLPIERPSHFELVVNMKTAQSLEINLPDSIIARADKLIE
jgi:putative ABC transport system substrate-binding protein